METIILGDGPLGRAVADALAAEGVAVRVLGRPARAPTLRAFDGVDLIFEASRGRAVRANVAAGLEGGGRRFVIATTAWGDDRRGSPRSSTRGAAAVAGANFSLGARVFGRLVASAAEPSAACPPTTRSSWSGTGAPRRTGHPAPLGTWPAASSR